MKPHRSTLILVLGILSLVVCQPLGFFAWIMGNSDLRLMDAGQMDPTGRETTNIGKILGIIGVALFALTAVVLICIFGLGLFGAVVSSQTNH